MNLKPGNYCRECQYWIPLVPHEYKQVGEYRRQLGRCCLGKKEKTAEYDKCMPDEKGEFMPRILKGEGNARHY